MANSGNVSLGPGTLKFAVLGTPLPADLADALNAAFKEIGYTEEGSEFSYEISSEPVKVAESLDPVFYKTTGRQGTVTFAMAENTARNMTLAFNGGTVVKTAAGNIKYEPPEPGTEVRRVLLFESEDGEERWVFPQVYQGGSVSLARRPGADKATIPVEFRLEKPASGGAPFSAYYADERDGGTGILTAATGATAGLPGAFTPAGSTIPANLAAMTGVTASPATAWVTGQYVVLGDSTNAYWNGTTWVAGIKS